MISFTLMEIKKLGLVLKELQGKGESKIGLIVLN